MGRYLSSNLCAHPLGGNTLRLYCKLRHLIGILRNFPHLSKTPISLDLISFSLLSAHQPPTVTRRAIFKYTRLNHSNKSYASSCTTREGKCLWAARLYSSSNRDVFKADGPVGVLRGPQMDFQQGSLGVRLVQSFHRLSRHINVYVKGKDESLVPVAGNAGLTVTPQGYLGRSQRRGQGQRATIETKEPEDKDRPQTVKCQETHAAEVRSKTDASIQTHSGLQLFHISSLATRFGESYNYVANHINTVFSRGPAKPVPETLHLSDNRGSTRRQRRKAARHHGQRLKERSVLEEIKMRAGQAQCATAGRDETVSNWEEGYRYFARHINRYFGASIADEVDRDRCQKEQLAAENRGTYQDEFPAQSTPKSQSVPPQLKQKEQLIPKPQGLFHTSSHTMHFGESYCQMANHINRYFKGEGVLEEEEDINHVNGMDAGSTTTQKRRSISLMDCLLHPTSAIPNLLGGYLKLHSRTQSKRSRPTSTPVETTLNRGVVLSRRQAEEMTHGLIGSMGAALSPDALTARMEELNEHLIRYPSCRAIMWQEKIAVKLVKQRRRYKDDHELQRAIRETLALIGYVDPVKGRGIRVLSIDGGGTRGVVPLQVLKLLEAETGKKIHQLFDYICGVSTGAVLAYMLGLSRFSLEECADMYRRFGSDVFRQNRLVGTVKMGWSHSYYNTETWERILRDKMGEQILIRTARDEISPKVSAVSAVVNWGNSPKAFVFRNYNHTPGSLSRYAGGSGYQMWQAVRASSAAPGYFQEFPLQSDIHQDGGIILNNPCALAVHESRLLWPNQPFQCVLSLGTGRYDSVKRGPITSTSLRAKISNLISSATDTEGVHTLLDDLLAPDIYFRFNPMLSAEVSLDESRRGALDKLQEDTQIYLERNRLKLARLCMVLGAERSAVNQTEDWIRERAWELKQRWV